MIGETCFFMFIHFMCAIAITIIIARKMTLRLKKKITMYDNYYNKCEL